MNPQLVVLAGPNGAGKTTFYDAFLSASALPFLNADHFAAETGVDATEAARILDATRAKMIDDRIGFITETVFSDPYGAKLDMLRQAIENEFDVIVVYIGLANPTLSMRRVEQRVAAGGHDVPADRIEPRYERSLENLKTAVTFVPVVKVYDNSSSEEPYRLLATFEDGKLVTRAKGRLPSWVRDIVPGPAR